MKRGTYIMLIFLFLIIAGVFLGILLKKITPDHTINNNDKPNQSTELIMNGNLIYLPKPETKVGMSLSEALALRRSTRSFVNKPLSISQISQLLWSAQGINNETGFRTAPSAGATFPLEMYLMINNATTVPKGLYYYDPAGNTLKHINSDDLSSELVRASHSQAMISDAAVVLIFGAVFERTTARYGERGERYVYNEVGHAAQNVHLQSAALGLGTVVIGAFRDQEVEEILNLGEDIRVLYMMPVGKMN